MLRNVDERVGHSRGDVNVYLYMEDNKHLLVKSSSFCLAEKSVQILVSALLHCHQLGLLARLLSLVGMMTWCGWHCSIPEVVQAGGHHPSA